MVCPTCFCSTVEEVSDLSGTHVRRDRFWESCFTSEHSYMNSGTVRKAIGARYRQWLTHKLASWIDQFGASGCVGLRALHHLVPGRHRPDPGSRRHPGRTTS